MPLGAPPQLNLTPQTFDPLSGINLSNLNFPDFSKGLTALGSFVPDATAAAIAQTQKDTQKQTVDKLTSQILDQTPAKYWSGEGFGGAEANARALAGILYSNGITDTSQFAKRDTLKPLTDQNIVQYKLGNQGANKVVDPDTGETYYTTYDPSTDSGRRLTDAEVKKLTQVYGIPNYDEYGGYLPLSSSDIVTKDGKQYYKSGQEYYNKDTGIVLDTKKGLNDQYLSTPWSQTGNFFGKTYAGSGSTNYNVEFDAQGIPHFYTTYGGSSSDLGAISPIVSLLSVLPTPIQPFAAAANAVIAAKQGNPLQALASVAGIPGISEAAGAAGLGSLTSGIQAANQVNNLVNAVQSGNLAGALASGANLTGTGGTEIGDTGVTVGQAAKGIGALQAASSGNYLPLVNTLAGAATATGPKASDIEAGSFPSTTPLDTGIAGLLGTGADITAQYQANQAAAQQPVSTSLPSGWTPAIQDYSEQGGAGSGGYGDWYDISPSEPTSTLDTTAPSQDNTQAGAPAGVQTMADNSLDTTDWASLYATPTTDPVTGQTITGADVSQYPSQDIQITPSNLSEFQTNLQNIWDQGGYTSQWQTVGSDRVMVQDDGSAIGINTETGATYSLDPASVSNMVKQGLLNTGTSGYVSATGGTGNVPGGTAPPSILDQLKKFLTQSQVGNVTGLGLLAGLGGIAGIKSLLAKDQARYGVPGRQDWAGPLGGYKFSPAAFQPTVVDPGMFRPRGVTTAAMQGYAEGGLMDQSPSVNDQELVYQNNPVVMMADGGQAKKPQYTGRAALAAMTPWQRAQAELNNAAYGARMPVAMQMPQAGIAQLGQFAAGGGISDLGSYSDGGRLLRGPGDGVSDSIPATIADKQPARLADGEFVIPARIVSELGNGSTDAGARQLYAMMDRVQKQRAKTVGKGKVAKDTKAAKQLPA